MRHFSLKTYGLAKLVGTLEINANFEIMSGHVDGIDLVRAMQVAGQNWAGGSTHFVKLSGHWILKDRHYHLRQLTLKAGQLQAHGEIDISAKQEVTGKIATRLILKSRQPQSRCSWHGKLGSCETASIVLYTHPLRERQNQHYSTIVSRETFTSLILALPHCHYRATNLAQNSLSLLMSLCT